MYVYFVFCLVFDVFDVSSPATIHQYARTTRLCCCRSLVYIPFYDMHAHTDDAAVHRHHRHTYVLCLMSVFVVGA